MNNCYCLLVTSFGVLKASKASTCYLHQFHMTQRHVRDCFYAHFFRFVIPQPSVSVSTSSPVALCLIAWLSLSLRPPAELLTSVSPRPFVCHYRCQTRVLEVPAAETFSCISLIPKKLVSKKTKYGDGRDGYGSCSPELRWCLM